jgi:hypothetical protein
MDGSMDTLGFHHPATRTKKRVGNTLFGAMGIERALVSPWMKAHCRPFNIGKIMDINAVIKIAKLGRTRRDAQVDTCAVFAAALYDVLSTSGLRCQMFTAVPSEHPRWAHVVIKVDGRYYDSIGEFSASIYRNRTKIHRAVSFDISYKPDSRSECYEPEFDELHSFYVKMLNRAISSQLVAMAA